MLILLHSSKTMRPPAESTHSYTQPALLTQAKQIASVMQALSPTQIATMMKLSPKLAAATHDIWQQWTPKETFQRPAIDSFLGDIYSGLQTASWTAADRTYANQHLRILSGLYGILRPLDGIYPYRLEMGYRLNGQALHTIWHDTVALTLPHDQPIVNLAAAEYSRTVIPYIPNKIVTPKFLTISSKTGQPTFVVVHAKIARGAFAYWLIRERIQSIDQLHGFTDLNYTYSDELSSPAEPVFVCKSFGGLGLSVRLT